VAITSIGLGAQQLPSYVTSNLGTLKPTGEGSTQLVLGVTPSQNTLGQTTNVEISRGVRPQVEESYPQLGQTSPSVTEGQLTQAQLAPVPTPPPPSLLSNYPPPVSSQGLNFSASGTSPAQDSGGTTNTAGIAGWHDTH
jgi:hypothetical protein